PEDLVDVLVGQLVLEHLAHRPPGLPRAQLARERDRARGALPRAEAPATVGQRERRRPERAAEVILCRLCPGRGELAPPRPRAAAPAGDASAGSPGASGGGGGGPLAGTNGGQAGAVAEPPPDAAGARPDAAEAHPDTTSASDVVARSDAGAADTLAPVQFYGR